MWYISFIFFNFDFFQNLGEGHVLAPPPTCVGANVLAMYYCLKLVSFRYLSTS
jgi:hypothetical protein